MASPSRFVAARILVCTLLNYFRLAAVDSFAVNLILRHALEQNRIRLMKVREAKDLLVQQIADEAQAQGKPLSDLERRMLYFTESNDAIEDPAALSAEFAAQYDSAEYELKVARLLRNAHKRIKCEDPEAARTWTAAVREVRRGDHYLLVLWGISPPSERPVRDSLKHFGIGIAIAVLIFLVAILWGR
jgi:hypothetical protein